MENRVSLHPYYSEKSAVMAKKESSGTEVVKVVTSSDGLQAEVANCDIQSSRIESMIRLIRGKQVILDRDLSSLYNVETRRLNEQVKRNTERFPEDFMFQLSKEGFEDWKSQFATSINAAIFILFPNFNTTRKIGIILVRHEKMPYLCIVENK